MAKDFGKRFIEARKNARYSISDIAKHLGVSVQSVYGWEQGSTPKAERMNELASLFEVPVEWLAFGEGSPCAKCAEDGSWSVPMLKVEASAGFGMIADSESIVKLIQLDQVWVARECPGVTRGALSVVTVDGDSMEPTYHDKDLLLVDTSVHAIRGEGFYVIGFDGRLYVKRVQPIPGNKLLVISDNTGYKTFTVDLSDESTQFIVCGRVVYSWTGSRR